MQSYTIESRKASYYHTNIWATVSSTWDICTAHQMLGLTAIHTDKTEREYKCHFEEDLENFKYSTHPLSTFEDFAAG